MLSAANLSDNQYFFTDTITFLRIYVHCKLVTSLYIYIYIYRQRHFLYIHELTL
jgi:hypothetical protein